MRWPDSARRLHVVFGCLLSAFGSQLISCSGPAAQNPFPVGGNPGDPGSPGKNQPPSPVSSITSPPPAFDVVPSGVHEDLYALAWLPGEGGLACGAHGTVVRISPAGVVEVIQSTVSRDLRGVCLARAGEGWLVGEEGLVLHWDGTRLEERPGPQRLDLLDCDALPEGWARAVGEGGQLLNLDGQKPVTAPSPAGFSGRLRGIRVAAQGHVYVCGDSGSLFFGDDKDSYVAQRVPGGQGLADLDFTDVTKGWAVGDFGTLLRFTDRGWEEMRAQGKLSANLEGIAAQGDRALACGQKGTLVEIQGASARVLDPPQGKQDLYGVAWGDGSFWVVGEDGLILRSKEGSAAAPASASAAPSTAAAPLIALSAAVTTVHPGQTLTFTFSFEKKGAGPWKDLAFRGNLPSSWYLGALSLNLDKEPVTLASPPAPPHAQAPVPKVAEAPPLLWAPHLTGKGRLNGSYRAWIPPAEARGMTLVVESLRLEAKPDPQIPASAGPGAGPGALSPLKLDSAPLTLTLSNP